MQLPPQAARQDSACGARATRTRGALRRRTSSLARPRALRAREALVWMPGTKLSKHLLAAAIVALLDASTAALPRWHDAGQFTLQELVESATTAPPAATAPPSALSDAEIARIATFGAVLGQYDACHDSAVVRTLNDTLNTEWSQAERETWLAIGRRQGDARGWPPERLARCPLAQRHCPTDIRVTYRYASDPQSSGSRRGLSHSRTVRRRARRRRPDRPRGGGCP